MPTAQTAESAASLFPVRAVYYFSKTIPQRDVVRLKGYTTPIGDPDESLPLDPD